MHQRDHLQHLPPDAVPAVFAARADVVFAAAARPDEAETAITRFLAALARGLAEAGCTLVGHIKGALVAPGHGDLSFHATSLTAAPRLTGGLAGDSVQATLTVNVIAFGVAGRELPGIVTGAWAQASGAETGWSH